jgi:hypothetical protein
MARRSPVGAKIVESKGGLRAAANRTEPRLCRHFGHGRNRVGPRAESKFCALTNVLGPFSFIAAAWPTSLFAFTVRPGFIWSI